MSKVALIINPNAQRNRKREGWLETQLQLAEGHGQTWVTKNEGHLRDILLGIDLAEFDFLALSGGDGSLHSALSVLRNAGRDVPNVMFVPSGTMNMMATSLKLPKTLAPLQQAIQKQPASWRSCERDLLCVNDKYYGFLTGTGLIANFLQAYYDEHGDGHVAAAKMTAKFISSVIRGTNFARNLVASAPTRLTADGQTHTLNATTAVIAQTIENLAVGFTPMYRATEKKGTFHAIALNLSTVAIVNNIDRIFRGLPWNRPDVLDTIMEELVIEFDHDTVLQVDGEIYPAERRNVIRADQTVTFVLG